MSPRTAAAGPDAVKHAVNFIQQNFTVSKKTYLVTQVRRRWAKSWGRLRQHARIKFQISLLLPKHTSVRQQLPRLLQDRDSPAPTDKRLSFQSEAQIWGQVSGLRTCPVLLHHAVHTGSVRYASGRCVAQVPHAAVSGLAVEAMEASVMGQLLVESWHAPVRRAFLRASVAGGGEPVFRRKSSRLIQFRLLRQVCTRTTILIS